MSDGNNINGSSQDLTALQGQIGYFFTDSALLLEALTHKSYANEMQLENVLGNERLEFMGDAVLGMAVSQILMDRFPGCPEGKLSKMRAAIVNTAELARRAKKFGISRYILLSRGEDEGAGRDKKSILANTYEAIIAAVYYDGGYEPAFQMIESHFGDIFEEVARKGFFKDYKSRLQELSQQQFGEVPGYVPMSEEGPDHIKVFEVQVEIGGVVYECGKGSSKKEAEQEAARRTLSFLENDSMDPESET